MRGSLNTRLGNQTIEQGTRDSTGVLSVRYIPRDEYRYAPVVSKKQGNAVKRNRVKRVIRRIMSINRDRFPKGYYLIYYRCPCSDMNSCLLEKSLNTIADQITIQD